MAYDAWCEAPGRMTYAVYVGFLQLELPKFQARQPLEGFDGYIEHMMATLIPRS